MSSQIPQPPLVRELPTNERPRERLLMLGGRALTDVELLAVLLRSGRRGASALMLAHEILASVGGLGGLLGVDPRSLGCTGLGPAKRSSILAAVEMARRLARAELPERSPMTRPESVARYLTLRYRRDDQEVMGALYLDSRHHLLAEEEIYRGTLNRAAVEPRALLKHALLAGAASLVIFHTHPSGDPSPSAEDLAFTRRMAEASEVVGLHLVDHLILGVGERWVSLAERGAW